MSALEALDLAGKGLNAFSVLFNTMFIYSILGIAILELVLAFSQIAILYNQSSKTFRNSYSILQKSTQQTFLNTPQI
jgi:hypothetical protein